MNYDELFLSNFALKKLKLSHQLNSEALDIRRTAQRISIQFYYVMK